MLQGRRWEQERIDALLAAAAQGSGGAVALVGEAGAGKSALLEHARERAVAFKTTAVPASSASQTLVTPASTSCCGPGFR